MTEDDDRPAADAGNETQVAVPVDQDQSLGVRKRGEGDVPGMAPFLLASPVHWMSSLRSCRLFERVVASQVPGKPVNDRAGSRSSQPVSRNRQSVRFEVPSAAVTTEDTSGEKLFERAGREADRRRKSADRS